MDEIRGQLASGNRYRATSQEVEILDSAGNSMRKLSISEITAVARSGQSVYIDDNAGNRLELITASVLDGEQLESKVRMGLQAQAPAGGEFRNDPLPGAPPPASQRDGFPNIGPGQTQPPPPSSPGGFPQQSPQQPTPGQPGQPRGTIGRKRMMGCLVGLGIVLLLCVLLAVVAALRAGDDAVSTQPPARATTVIDVVPTSTSSGSFLPAATPTAPSTGVFPTVTSASGSSSDQPSANDVRVRLADGASAEITTSTNRTTRVEITRIVDNVTSTTSGVAPAAGNRWWGAEIGLHATGSDSVFVGGWTLRTTDGREYQRSIIKNVGQDIGYGQLQVGQSRRGTIIFEIPSNAQVESVRYDPDTFNPGVVYFEAR